jgi:hypothetical protein
MRSLKSLRSSRTTPRGTVIDIRAASQRIVLEYILNMAVTCLAHGDIDPLYAHYMEDLRLVDEDKDELARAYLLLQMSPIAPIV